MAIIVPSGKLTAQVIEELAKFFDTAGPTEEIRWGLFGEEDIKDFGEVRRADCLEVLTLINLQLAKTKAYIGGKKPTRELCPHPDLLKVMIEKKVSIRNLADLEYKKEDILKDFSQYDLVKVVEVINWCRRFFTDPTMSVFISLETDLFVGGKIYPGDSHGPSTTNAGATDSITNTSGDMVGRIHAEDGVIITIGGKPYNSKNPDHRKLAAKKGYDPNTGVEN